MNDVSGAFNDVHHLTFRGAAMGVHGSAFNDVTQFDLCMAVS